MGRNDARAWTSGAGANGDPYALTSGPAWVETPRLTVAACAAAFEHAVPFTVGVEEELLLVDPATLELVPGVNDVLDLLGDDRRPPSGSSRTSALRSVSSANALRRIRSGRT
jgi:hypothetical protein